MYNDDPTPLIELIEVAWEDYIVHGQQKFEEAESQVVEWRFSADDLFLPDHPFAQLFEIRNLDPWRPRPIRFVKRDESAFQPRHGFDARGHIVIAGNHLIVYGDGFHDILTYQRERDSRTREFTGRISLFSSGTFHRHFTDESHRIIRSIRFSNRNQREYRSLNTFRWEDGRLEESFRQSFHRAIEGVNYFSAYPPGAVLPVVRDVNENLRESMASRIRTEYTYDDSGRLTRVADYKDEAEPWDVLYTYNPSDTIENVSKELVKLLSKQLVKTISAFKEAHPIRYVALQYSAEHSHCGLPTEVLLSSAGEEINPLDWESYAHTAEWPPAGRTGTKYEGLQRRLQLVVEGSSKYAEDFQPLHYRQILWHASRLVYSALAKKRTTTDDFAIFPLDDHGDADALEDIRESLPSSVAERVSATTESG